jgi:putative Mn2+ efflux pump MntP
MPPLELLLIAVGLAADAFAVSVAEGIAIEDLTHTHTLRMSGMFGLFQGLMPILGWSLGMTLRGAIGTFDHWVAFVLLGFVGGKMLVDSMRGVEEQAGREESRGLKLIALAVATSVDALAVGVSIAMMRVHIWWPALVIAAVTAVMCAVGAQAGKRIGAAVGRKAETVGGIILIGVGLKILLSHM